MTSSGTWHHGLVARWWAEFNHATDDELSGRAATGDDGMVVIVARP